MTFVNCVVSYCTYISQQHYLRPILKDLKSAVDLNIVTVEQRNCKQTFQITHVVC